MIYLTIALIICYSLGAVLAMLLCGWDATYSNNVIKILFWPIAIFLEK